MRKKLFQHRFRFGEIPHLPRLCTYRRRQIQKISHILFRLQKRLSGFIQGARPLQSLPGNVQRPPQRRITQGLLQQFPGTVYILILQNPGNRFIRNSEYFQRRTVSKQHSGMAEMVQSDLSRAYQQERHHHDGLPQLVIRGSLSGLPSLPVHTRRLIRKSSHAFLNDHGRQLHQFIFRLHLHGIRRNGSHSGKKRTRIP